MKSSNNLESKPKKQKLDDVKQKKNEQSPTMAEVKALVSRLKQQAKQEYQWYRRDDHLVENVLRDAILAENIDIVRYLLAEGVSANSSADVEGNNNFFRKPIGFAAQTGNLPIVQLLIEHRAEIKPHNSYYNDGDNSGIEAAVEHGKVDVATYLLDKGAESDGTLGYVSHNWTYLGIAALDQNKVLADELVMHGADIRSALSLNYERFHEKEEVYQRAINEYKRSIEHPNGLFYGLSFSETVKNTELKRKAEEKNQLEKSYADLKKSYHESVKFLLDYAVGVDFYSEYSKPMEFLKGIDDVSDMNFIGVSMAGKPVTREMLSAKNLQGVSHAIITTHDLDKMPSGLRSSELSTRLARAFKVQGPCWDISGVVNLVSLSKASEIGDRIAVGARLFAGINPNGEKGSKSAPVVLAAKNGHVEIVKSLTEHSAFDKQSLPHAILAAKEADQKQIIAYLTQKQDVNQRDTDGNTLLHHAVQQGNTIEVKRLLDQKAEINSENKSRSTPLYIAASKSYDKYHSGRPSVKHIEIISMLLDCKADANRSSYGYSPLDEAAEMGSSKAVELLLPHTIKKEVEYSKWDNEKKEHFPWYVDMMFNSYHSREWKQILTLLKANGADFNTRSKLERYTLLHRVLHDFPSRSSIRSSMYGKRDAIVDIEDRYMGSLKDDYVKMIKDSRYAYAKHMQLLDYILDNGADPRVTESENKNTALHTMLKHVDLSHVQYGYDQVVDKLLNKNCNINAANKDGESPLHVATVNARFDAVKCLLERKANINQTDGNGRTALHLAAAGSPLTTELLITSGADIHAKDINGDTPLISSGKWCIENAKFYQFPTTEAKLNFERPYKESQAILWDALYAQQQKTPDINKEAKQRVKQTTSEQDQKRDARPMVVLFLDIDGVLYARIRNNYQSMCNAMKRHRDLGIKGVITYKEWDESAVNLFDRNAIHELDQLIASIEQNYGPVGIVISSSWRELRSKEELVELFREHAFSQKIIGKTIDDSNILFKDSGVHLERGEQIELWLQENRERFNIGNYLILDDLDLDISPLFNHFIHCNSNQLFTAQNRVSAIDMLSKSQKQTVPNEKVTLVNQVSLVVSDEKSKTTEVKQMRLSQERRRDFISLFAKQQMPQSESPAKLISEYDTLDNMDQTTSTKSTSSGIIM